MNTQQHRIVSGVTVALLALGGLASSKLYAADPPASKPAPAEGPGLPVHTIEGVGGGAITPTAYLVNPAPNDGAIGLPSLSATYVNLEHGKNLETAAITETLFGRVELGFSPNRLGIGDLHDDIKDATGIDVKSEVYLYNFNARVLAIKENDFGTSWLPAITLGASYKYNDGISDINHELGGALSSIGYDKDSGYDLTLTASKTFGNVFGRPLILSAGLRNSSAAWVGYLGFSDERKTTFEGNAIYIPLDWLAVGYEFRQQSDPYSEIPGLVEGEDNLHAFSLIFLPNSHLSVALVYGIFGNVANSESNSSFAIQAKYEF
jgi:hypothetical protein